MKRRRAAPRSFLVDSNLLVLWVAGTWRPELIGQHKRLRDYSREDRQILGGILLVNRRPVLLTTPHILTEVSNLLRFGHRENEALMAHLGKIVKLLEERHLPAETLVSDLVFRRLGLVDAGVLALAAESGCVLTDDWALHQTLLDRNLPSQNFNHLRLRGWEKAET